MNAAAPFSSARLPAHIAFAIRQIAAELRHIPRDAVTDRLELITWLSGRARRLDDVAASRMLAACPAPISPVAAAAPAPCAICNGRRRSRRRCTAVPAGQLHLPFPDPHG